MRSPHEVFLNSGHADAWKKIVASSAFEPACHLALAQLSSQLAPTTTPGLPTDPYVAIDANSQMFGARRVLEILYSLSDPIKASTESKHNTLHY